MNLKFAFMTRRDDIRSDKLFDKNDLSLNRDHILDAFYELQQTFLKNGDEIHTIDMYEEWRDIDYFIFMEVNWEDVNKIISLGKGNSMIYYNAEPPSVDKRNTPQSYFYLKHIFPYILSWNDKWIDNKSIFKKKLPYTFIDSRMGALPFEEKKMITFISANKKSTYPGELYSERIAALEFFENNYPKDFDFYGVGWESVVHPCYRGMVDDKSETYHKYRFAICYENVGGFAGYITEKVFDCLCAGIVPIYAGAPEVGTDILKGAVIMLSDFSGYEELAEYIYNMGESEYNDYIMAADKFLCGTAVKKYSGEGLANYIYHAIEVNKNDFIPSKAVMFLYRKFLYY